MSSAAEWKVKVLDTLAREPTAIPGRAGETPLSNLANQVVAIKASGGNLAPLGKGLSNVIRSLGEADPERWSNLCHLVQLAGLHEANVSSSLYDEFTKGIPQEVRSRAVILVTLAEMGRRWTPVELRKEQGVREQFASEWVDAWVKSGLFDQAKDEIENLLITHAVTARDLLRRMPAWYQRLGEKLLEILPKWLGLIQKEERPILEGWLHNRGLQFVHSSATVVLQSIRATGIRRWKPLIERDDVEFVRNAAAQKAKRLNGQTNS